MVQGMVFDTASGNTGMKAGAGPLIKKALYRDLIYIGCRHHVFEVMSAVCAACLGPTSGSEMKLFKQFQEDWVDIDQCNFQPANDELFVGMMENLRQQMVPFFAEAMKHKSAREDYDELLQLSHLFLCGSLDADVSFRASGAKHNARWMAKATYSLKMFLFRGQAKLKKKQTAGLTKVSFFVSPVYARYWHEAAMPEKAPLNDLQLLALLHEYPYPEVRKAAIDAL